MPLTTFHSCFLAETRYPQSHPFKASWPHCLLRKRDDPYPESPALGPTLWAEALKKGLPVPLLQGRVHLVWHSHWEVCSFKICPTAVRTLPLTRTLLQTVSKQHILLRIRVSDGPKDKELTRPGTTTDFCFCLHPSCGHPFPAAAVAETLDEKKGLGGKNGNFPSISHSLAK